MKGADCVQENSVSAAAPIPKDVPVLMRKRIGSTTYEVAVHFSQRSKEDMNDKIARLIKSEVSGEKAVDE